jgi:ribose-phosphate pyrophosphokinase
MDVVIVDDLCDTAGTLAKASKKIKTAGANSVRAVITHPVLSGNAYSNINESELNELLVSNSLEIKDLSNKIIQVDSSIIFANAIKAVVDSTSLHKING